MPAARSWPTAPPAGCPKTWRTATACPISVRRWARPTCRCHARPRGDLRRRGERRTDRSQRRAGPRQFRRHGPALGRDGRPATADQPVGRRTPPLCHREDEDRVPRDAFPPHSTPSSPAFPRPRPTAWTACGWTGQAAGCWSDRATPSRSSARLPKPQPSPRRGALCDAAAEAIHL